MYVHLRQFKDEIVKDREALAVYADPENWRISPKTGKHVFIGPLDGPEVAQRALNECHVARTSLPRSAKRVRNRLIAA